MNPTVGGGVQSGGLRLEIRIGNSSTAGSQRLSLLPMDYLGERDLSPGRCTYSLDLDNGRLAMQFETAE